MARTQRDLSLPVLPDVGYMLARASGCEIPSFQLSGQDPTRFLLRFARGFGWSNPIDVEVAIWQSGPQQSTLRYEASILALADPFGFMDKNLDRFQQHLMAHHHAWLTQTPPPPPPKDTHSMKVNLIIIAALVGVILLIFVLGIAMAVMR